MLTIQNAIEYAKSTLPSDYRLSNTRMYQNEDGQDIVAIDLDHNGEAVGTFDIWFEETIGKLYGEY